jgi:hypothetical protein
MHKGIMFSSIIDQEDVERCAILDAGKAVP